MPAKPIRILQFLSISTMIYFAFLIRGMAANHYMDWSLDFKIGDCIEIILFTLPLTYLLLKWLSTKQNAFRDSLWLGLSFSIPYVLYDALFLGFYKGYGAAYLGSHWFLTIFYVIAPVEIAVIGYLVQNDDGEMAKTHLQMLSVSIAAWGLNWWEGSFSHHYIDWPLNMKIVRLSNIGLILLPLTWILLRWRSRPGEFSAQARWLAFYLSATFALFDFFYLGIARGYGAEHVSSLWHVAVFYPIVWIEVPWIGWLMDRKAA